MGWHWEIQTWPSHGGWVHWENHRTIGGFSSKPCLIAGWIQWNSCNVKLYQRYLSSLLGLWLYKTQNQTCCFLLYSRSASYGQNDWSTIFLGGEVTGATGLLIVNDHGCIRTWALDCSVHHIWRKKCSDWSCTCEWAFISTSLLMKQDLYIYIYIYIYYIIYIYVKWCKQSHTQCIFSWHVHVA